MLSISKEQSEVLKNAIKTFGERNQEDIAIEEMAELTKAIIKNRRYNTDETKANIVEETADVLIMLYQLMFVYGVPSQVFEAKIDRLKQRLDEEDKRRKEALKLVDEVYSKIPQRSSFSVSKDCKNLGESFGEICVKCNACGRFDCEINQNIESCEDCGFCSNNGEIKKINEITQEIIEAIEKKTYESMPFNEISITEINNHCVKTIKELCDMGYITVKEDVNKIYINNENVDDIDFLCCLPLAFPEMDKKIYTVNINGKDIGQVEYYGLLEQDKESGIYNIGYNMTFKYHEPIESLCVSFEIGGENNA